jgi:hypothetical protein
MSSLEALQPNTSVRGILPDCLVTVVSVQWFGSEALELTYKDPTGKVANQLLYRHDEPRLDVVVQGTGLNLSHKQPCALSWELSARGGFPWHIRRQDPVPMPSFGTARRSLCPQ